MLSRIAVACTVLLASCQVELNIPEEASVTCKREVDCPQGWRCDTFAGRCLPPSAPVQRCGNGLLNPDEECDCGSTADSVPADCQGPNSDTAPNRCRSDCQLPRCGAATTAGALCCK